MGAVASAVVLGYTLSHLRCQSMTLAETICIKKIEKLEVLQIKNLIQVRFKVFMYLFAIQ